MSTSTKNFSRTVRIGAAVLFAAYAVFAVGCSRPGEVRPPLPPVNPGPSETLHLAP